MILSGQKIVKSGISLLIYKKVACKLMISSDFSKVRGLDGYLMNKVLRRLFDTQSLGKKRWRRLVISARNGIYLVRKLGRFVYHHTSSAFAYFHDIATININAVIC